jgi:radical SAM superfamily enzyme YgiQ (UPF0313 family)
MKRALLFYPPQNCLEQAVRLWTFSHLSNFPLAAFRMATRFRRAGFDVDFVDALNVHENDERSMQGVFNETRLVRQAPCGNFSQERRHKPVYRVGLTSEEISTRFEALPPPDEIFVSSVFTWTWQTTHESIDLLRRHFPRARIHLGGIYPQLCPDRARAAGADDVDSATATEVDRSWLDVELLRQVPRLEGVVLKTSVGCPFGCSYCAVHLLEGNRHLTREPGDVLDEMEALTEIVGVTQFHFWESNLLLQKERHLLPILRGLRQRGRLFSLQAPEGFEPSAIDAEIAHELKVSGFREIRLTLETTAAARLAESGRVSGAKAVERAVGHLIDAGFARRDIFVVLLIGQPGQTLDDVLRDIVRVYGLGVATTFLVYSPIPGTVDYGRLGAAVRDRLLEDFDSFLYPMASPELTTVQLDTVLGYFNNRFLPLSRIAASTTEDRLVRQLQERIRDEAVA